MNNYKNRQLMNNIEDIDNRINSLEYLKRKKESIMSYCNHDMIFVNSSIDTKSYGNIYVGTCIICGKGMHLKTTNFHNAIPTEKLYYRDVDSGHDYPEDNVLNITNSEFVDEYGELFEIAHNTYKEMLEKDYYLYKEDEIKNEIIKNFKSKIKKKIK